MPTANRHPIVAPERRYTMDELLELRRQMLRYARSVPTGPERNKHWQVAQSLKRLFGNAAWLDAHTVEGSAPR